MCENVEIPKWKIHKSHVEHHQESHIYFGTNVRTLIQHPHPWYFSKGNKTVDHKCATEISTEKPSLLKTNTALSLTAHRFEHLWNFGEDFFNILPGATWAVWTDKQLLNQLNKHLCVHDWLQADYSHDSASQLIFKRLDGIHDTHTQAKRAYTHSEWNTPSDRSRQSLFPIISEMIPTRMYSSQFILPSVIHNSSPNRILQA